MGLEWDTEALQKDINTVTDNPLFHLIADGFNGIVNNLGYAGGGIEQLLNGQDAQADADAGHGGLYHFFNTIANVFRGFMGLEWDSESLGNTIAEITDNKLFHIIADSFGSLGTTFNTWTENAAGAINKDGPIVGGFVIVENLLRGLFGLEWDPSPMQTAITSVTTTITGAFKTISSKFDELCKWWADFSIVGTGKTILL